MKRKIPIFIVLLVGLYMLWFFVIKPIINIPEETWKNSIVLNYLIPVIAIPLLGAMIQSMPQVIWDIIKENKQKKEQKKVVVQTDRLLIKTTPEQLLVNKLGDEAAKINWIDRDVVTIDDIRSKRLLLLTGRMKIGKTREAVELIRKMVDNGLVPSTRVFDLSDCLREYPSPESARSEIDKKLDRGTPAVFIFDELPRNYFGNFRDNLEKTLDVIKTCSSYFVIATSRIDLLDEEYKIWLTNQGFHSHEVKSLEKCGILRLVDNVAGILGLQIEKDAILAFIQHSDGTPYQTYFSLKRIKTDGLNTVTKAIATEYTSTELLQAWADVRQELKDKYPLTEFIFDSLGVFHSLNIGARQTVVEGFVIWQARKVDRKPIKHLENEIVKIWEILKAYQIQIHSGKFIFPDPAVEGLIDSEYAFDQLADFLLNYSKLLKIPLLNTTNLLLEQREDYSSTSLILAYLAMDNNEPARALNLVRNARMYSVKSPIIWSIIGDAFYRLSTKHKITLEEAKTSSFTINYPFLSKKQTVLSESIAAYQEAIRLNPDDARIHNNLGIAFRKQDKLEEAVGAFQEAIRLNPDDARIHHNLGTAYGKQDKLEEAVGAYQEAIRLNPDDAVFHYNLGIAFRKQDKLEEAVAAYQEAIRLNPDDADFHHNLGIAYRLQGKLEEAVATFQEVIRLGHDQTLPRLNIGAILIKMGKNNEAEAEFAKIRGSISKESEYTRACFEALSGDPVKAFDLLESAIEKGEVSKEWVLQDPDWDDLREDPRFKDILGLR